MIVLKLSRDNGEAASHNFALAKSSPIITISAHPVHLTGLADLVPNILEAGGVEQRDAPVDVLGKLSLLLDRP